MGGNEYIVVNLYRPPSGSKVTFLAQFDDFLAQILDTTSQIILFGDFNFDLLSKESTSLEFLETLDKYDLSQIIDQPTRSAALLDLVIIPSSEKKQDKYSK